MSETFYKLARPDGWDFYTGNTINYRENIGKIVRRPNKGKMRLCSGTVIHASREPNQCFIGAEIPCSAYLVEGKPYVEDDDKCGFKQLKVIKELKPEKLFKWKYKEACNPVHPFKIAPPKKITKEHIALMIKWASVRDSVGDSVRDSVWTSVGDSVGDSVRAYIGSLFIPVIKEWKYIEHEKGEYPFQPVVDLWKMGLVPSFDGRVWRLHGGKDARVLWEGEPK